MKRILLLLMLTFTVSATNYQELFLQANREYAAGHFAQALEKYQQLPRKSVGVWYTMGTAAAAMHEHKQAYWYWLHVYYKGKGALLYRASEQLKEFNTETGLCHASWYLLYLTLLRSLSLLVLQILFFCAFGVFLFRVCFWYRNRRFYYVLTTVIITISLGAAVYVKYRDIHTHYGMINDTDISLYAGPQQSYHVLAPVPYMAVVQLQEEGAQWSKVRYGRMNGWILTSHMNVI